MQTSCRNRMLACYTRFVLVTIYVCRSRGSTKRVFSQAVSLLYAIFQYKISYNAFALGADQKVQLAVVEPFDRLRNHLSKPPYSVQWSLLIGQPLSSILFRSSSAVQLSFYLTKLIFTVCALQVLVRTKPVTFRIFCPLYFPVNNQNYRSKE